MNWEWQWLDDVLSRIPAGRYRQRVENELRDHLEAQYHALKQAGRLEAEARKEALRVMGNPDRLRAEYAAAWRKSLPGRLNALGGWLEGFGYRLSVWMRGWLLMFCVQWLGASVLRGLWLSLALTLTAGALYLAWKFRNSDHPAWQISVGLSFHWMSIAALLISFEAADDHLPFWEEAGEYLAYNAGFIILAFGFCALLGVVFGNLFVGGGEHADAAL